MPKVGLSCSVFWRFQLAGWAAYIVFTLPIKLAVDSGFSNLIGAFVIRDGFSFIITLGMREVYHRIYQSHRELSWIAGTISIVSVAAGGIQIPIFYLLGEIFPFEEETLFSRAVPLGIFYYRTGLFTCWSLLYFGIKEVREVMQKDLRLALIESEKRDAQLRMLRAQLNPHFIFNALNAIQAEIGNPDVPVKQTVKELTQYLRFSLDHGDDELIPMVLEYDAVLSYFQVEKLRFGGDLVFECHIDEAVRQVLVPGIILQPLVENAVKYGQKTFDPPVRIQVDIQRLSPQELRIRVANTGEWLKPGQVAHEKTSHIGLANVQRRLNLLYPDKHCLTIGHGGGWVTVEIVIPIII